MTENEASTAVARRRRPARSSAETRAAAAPDEVLAAAGDIARAAAVDVGGELVGRALGVRVEGERVVTHEFESVQPGYRGWFWAVTLTRAPRSRVPSVAEVVMLPGHEALLAPAWVPWEERVQPGDLSPGDLLPPAPDDTRLAPAYVAGDDRYVRSVAWEIGLGRTRVLSREGVLDAADRWVAGETGPDVAMARQAPGRCGTCGFLATLAGSLAAGFGVCANEFSPADGRVVSVEYGCGAHSELRVSAPRDDFGDAVYDDAEIVPM